jgi:ribosomal-protein-alanine N-acetyltransferase
MIRLAITTDAPWIEGLILRTIRGATDTGSTWISEQIAGPNGLVLVSEVNKQIQGFILGQIVLDEAEIHDVGVAPTYQRTGIGFRLITAFEAMAVRQGATTCVLEVRASNTAARGAYTKAGYTEVGQRERYYADGENALLMRHDFQGAS